MVCQGTVRRPDQEKGVDENVEIGGDGKDAGILIYPEGELGGGSKHMGQPCFVAGLGKRWGVSSRCKGIHSGRSGLACDQMRTGPAGARARQAHGQAATSLPRCSSGQKQRCGATAKRGQSWVPTGGADLDEERES